MDECSNFEKYATFLVGFSQEVVDLSHLSDEISNVKADVIDSVILSFRALQIRTINSQKTSLDFFQKRL